MNARQKKAIVQQLTKRRLMRTVSREMGINNATVRYWVYRGFPKWREGYEAKFYEIGLRCLGGSAPSA